MMTEEEQKELYNIIYQAVEYSLDQLGEDIKKLEWCSIAAYLENLGL